jgi:phosphoribosylformimino-5-aminoimidazole carboxamide ribotide isomerase
MPSLTVIPAIDLKNGCCVRLRQGCAADVQVYSADPVAMARHWEAAGANYLHVVDLDGAFEGHPVHTAVIGDIIAAVRIPVEVGGGLRTDGDMDSILRRGAQRVIGGTRICEHPEDLAHLVRRFGPRLAVGVDARGGQVQTKGWVETTAISAVDLARRVSAVGVQTLIYTDTATDGMLAGPNMPAIRDICAAAQCSVIASGGISSEDDVRRLVGLAAANLTGIIIGKALYEGRLDLRRVKQFAGNHEG